jgi:hypothetical protein
MLLLLLDTVVLMAMLKWLCDEEMSLLWGIVFSFLSALGTLLIVAVGVVLLGFWGGLVLGFVVSGAIIGVTLSYFFGIEIKQACLIAGVFLAVHFGTSQLLSLALSWGT